MAKWLTDESTELMFTNRWLISIDIRFARKLACHSLYLKNKTCKQIHKQQLSVKYLSIAVNSMMCTWVLSQDFKASYNHLLQYNNELFLCWTEPYGTLILFIWGSHNKASSTEFKVRTILYFSMLNQMKDKS